jgi:hypothetical protein
VFIAVSIWLSQSRENFIFGTTQQFGSFVAGYLGDSLGGPLLAGLAYTEGNNQQSYQHLLWKTRLGARKLFDFCSATRNYLTPKKFSAGDDRASAEL